MKLTKLNQLLEDDKVVKGHWNLGPNHELQYRAEGLDEEIKLKGSLIAAEPDALVFAVTERQSDQKVTTKIARLTGAWSLDPKNRIIFLVEKEKSKTDTLTFKGEWEVDKNHSIIYTYETTKLKTKTKETQSLVFKGEWDITDKNVLTYSIDGDSNNTFRFRGTFETKSILAKKGEIRYQIGIEAQGKPKTKTITLFGKWKLSKDLSLSFEIEYDQSQKKTITFGGEYNLDEDKQIAVNLKSEEGKPLGVELILTKDFFGKDGQLFIRLQKTLEESSVEAGVTVKW